MQDMKKTTFNGKEIVILELTVKQVREVFFRIEKEDPLFVDDLLDQPVPALVIIKATGIPLEELEESKPSELAALAKEVESVNPSVASLVRRRLAVFERMQAMTLDQSSTGQHAG